MSRWISRIPLLAALAGCIRSVSAQATFNAEALWPLQRYKSTSIETPFLNVTKNGKTELGYLFFSPDDVLRQDGHPAIYDDDGELVWQGPNGHIFAFQPQTLDGEPVLTYWNGVVNSTGFGLGSISVLNTSYDEVYKVTLGEDQNFRTIYEPKTFPSYIDLHESFITEQGSILVTAVNVTQADLRSVGGPENGWVVNGLFYEIDIKTNEILFSWNALDHLDEIPFTLSRNPLFGGGRTDTYPWNFIHLNSVAKYGDSYLLSSRYMCSVFFIAKNGSVTWHLDGFNGGDFELGIGTEFCYQHDPRFSSHTANRAVLHLHNNCNTEYTGATCLTTGMELELDFQTKKASLLRRMWDAEHPVFAQSQGSYQALANQHVVLGHGATPVIEEYDENGALVMNARFGYDNTLQSYRAYRSAAWVGTPCTKPSVQACRDVQGSGVVVYVSWNGATDIESWKVYTGSATGKLQVAGEGLRNGFETIIRIDRADDKIVVEAVGGPNNGVQSEEVIVAECS